MSSLRHDLFTRLLGLFSDDLGRKEQKIQLMVPSLISYQCNIQRQLGNLKNVCKRKLLFKHLRFCSLWSSLSISFFPCPISVCTVLTKLPAAQTNVNRIPVSWFMILPVVSNAWCCTFAFLDGMHHKTRPVYQVCHKQLQFHWGQTLHHPCQRI